MGLLDEYNSLIQGLEDDKIEYATCGGLAMDVHGFVRATKHIDYCGKRISKRLSRPLGKWALTSRDCH